MAGHVQGGVKVDFLAAGDELLALEQAKYQAGFRFVVGIDEVGRGPLAGPVVAAAVGFPQGAKIPHVNDSKQLSEEKRLLLDAAIRAVPGVKIRALAKPATTRPRIIAVTMLRYRSAVGWPVRTKDSVATLAFSVSEQVGAFDASSGRKGLLLSLTDADVPVLRTQIDEVVFPTTWYGSLDNDIIGMYWGEKNRNETANADALAEQQLKNLEWHLAES